jgi:tRNA(Ile)-lysidine synthase
MRVIQTVLHAVEMQLQAHALRDCEVCVGLSGGVDSVVLLDTLRSLASAYRIRLGAIHVNHGLSPHANEWEAFCRHLCEASGVPLTVQRVRVVPDGDGRESAARDARFRVFAKTRCDFLALAHHVDDQAETLLLRLLRGAGAKGLGAMQVVRPWHVPGGADAGPAKLLRPLLEVSRRQIRDYAQTRELRWIEDESNADVSLDRNFLRLEVLPLIERRFPSAARTLARAARNLSDAALLADALGEIDWRAAAAGEGLAVEALRELGDARALNLLRRQFVRSGQPAPHRSALAEALRQCLSARDDAQVRVAFGTFSLRRFRGSVRLIDDNRPPPGWEVRWNGETGLLLPAPLGKLHFRFDADTGISRVRGRRGGERIAPGRNRPRRELKHLLQEMGLPPWERGSIPLLFCGETLAWVPGIGIAPEFIAEPGEAAVEISWDRHESSEKTAC